MFDKNRLKLIFWLALALFLLFVSLFFIFFSNDNSDEGIYVEKSSLKEEKLDVPLEDKTFVGSDSVNVSIENVFSNNLSGTLTLIVVFVSLFMVLNVFGLLR